MNPIIKFREMGRRGGAKRTSAKQRAAQTNGKRGGRPTTYRPQLCAQLRAYFDKEPFQEFTRSRTTKNGDVGTFTEFVPCAFPTLEGFCSSHNVTLRTLQRWGHRHPELAEAIEIAKGRQYTIILVNGLLGHYAQPFALFMMRTNFGWR